MKGAFLMETATNDKTKTPIVRKYDIRGTTYIVKATVKDGATEDAATKIRRMIRNDLGKQKK